MKKMLLIAALLFSLSGCYYEMVDSGEVGVEVRQGIVDKEIKTEGFSVVCPIAATPHHIRAIKINFLVILFRF